MKKLNAILTGLVVSGLSISTTVAQDEPPEESTSQGTIVVRSATTDGDGENVIVGQTIVASSPDGEPMALSFASPLGLGAFGAPDMQSMLGNMQVREELGLVDDQMDEIREIQREFSKRMQEETQSLMKGGFDPSRAQEMGERLKTVQATMKEKLNGVLLPHQQKRLKQLGFHMEMQNRPGGDALINGRLADELELTSEQKEELKERAEKLEKELEEKIAQLKKKARAELLEGLTSKQREKLDDLLGDSFEYEAPKFGNRIRQIRDRAKERAADKE